MADVHSKEIRSKNMAAIKGKNTKPEMLVRRFLHANGFRYKLHDKTLSYQILLMKILFPIVALITNKVCCHAGAHDNPYILIPAIQLALFQYFFVHTFYGVLE